MPNDQTEHFDDRTKWDSWNPGEDNGVRGFSDQGWALPQDPSRYISFSDPYWGSVRDHARAVYGDPNIHYDTDDLTKPRHLVFGDGTRLPEDGRVVYHNTDSKQDWAQNKDGTASLVNPDGSLAPPTKPTSYRQQGSQYAPLDEHGRQVGPLITGAPNSANGFYTDPKTGALTPKNSNGDYYTVGPDGKKSYFDKSGAPITESQYSGTPDQHPPAPGDPAADTDEQQTGHGAAAVKKMQDELKGKYTKISDADERFAEALLTAHATTADGRNQLNDIQKQIIAAIDDPANELDTPAGERSFLSFLRQQAAETGRLMNSGALTAADQSKVAQATAALYAADSDNTGPANPDQPPAPVAPAPVPAPDPGAPDPAAPDPYDPGLGPAPQMPDPSLDPGTGADPFSELGSALPAALGGLGGLGSGLSSPLDALSGLGGLGSGLGDLGGGGHDHSDDDDSHGSRDDTKPPANNQPGNETTTPPGATPPGAGQPTPPNGTPGVTGQPPAPIATPAAASPTVTLPDGSTGTARTPQVAASIRDYLAGTPVDAAYRQNGLQLPPPGTPITNPVDTSALTCGDIAMFKDHYEPVLSAVKGYHNGQVVPLSSVTSSPDFMGFFNPAAAASAAPPAQTAGAAAPAPPPPRPGAEAPNPVPVPAGG